MAGGVFEQADWPDSRGDYVEVCDECRTAIWSTCWDEEPSDGFDVFDAFLRTNGWRNYCVPGDPDMSDGGVGSSAVKPNNSVIAFGGRFDGGVRTLTDAKGHALRFREYFERPGGVSLGLFPVEGDGERDGLPVVCELKYHADVRVEDCMARFLVEASRAVVSGNAEHEQCVVVTRPGVAVSLDLRSDAFAPAILAHGDGLGDAYPLTDHLCGIFPFGISEKGCLLYRWSDEGTAYKAALGPQPDQGRPDRAVVLDAGVWERAVPAMLNFFGQERPDFLCLRLVAHGAADWFERIYTMNSCRTAQQILDSARDAEGGGAMV